MSYRVAGCLICWTFFLPSLVNAEESFYQVVDPDGHVRTIMMPLEPGRTVKKVKPAPIADDKQRDKVQESVGQDSVYPAPGAAPGNFAPYNGDDYMDSERLESSNFNPEQKEKFYIINDGFGSRVERNTVGDPGVLDVKPVVKNAVTKELDIPFEMEEVREKGSIMAMLATDTLCLGSKALEKSKSLSRGRFDTLILDKNALQYREPLGVVGAYKISERGMKALILRSYAGSERTPGYVSPLLAMADDNGCITRTVTGYFRSRYEATKARHSMLEGEVTIHADELYVLLISSGSKKPAGQPYKQSQYGQLSIKWQP